MPKYQEWNAQEAQEEEYLRLKHLDDEYWFAQFSDELRVKEPPFVAMALNSQGQHVMVRGLTEDEVHVACFANQLQLLGLYQPKQFI